MHFMILVTGGAGFIGSNFVKLALAEGLKVINLDALTYAGNLENLTDVQDNKNYSFIYGKIQDKSLVREIFKENKINCVVNFAAESHVDRSILNAEPFIETNINGTLVLLEAAKEFSVDKFIQISTDEVYGSLDGLTKFIESSHLQPNSPYAASKASADLIARAYYKTFNVPVIITRCTNNYGPNQFPEKFIPLMVLNAFENRKLPVYGDGLYVRDWIYVEDHCRAILKIMKEGKIGEIYNISSDCEKPNIEVIRLILDYLGKPASLIQYVKDRPGHDRRYALDASKLIDNLGWQPLIEFETGLKKTIQWYKDNINWCNNIRSGAYRDYYKRQYNVQFE